MVISRRGFFDICKSSVGALGLATINLSLVEKALANTTGPSVLWLQGSACTGCSVSFLNYYSPTAPSTAADVLISTVNLVYQPALMAAQGQMAVTAADNALSQGNYILVVEGGIPTAFGGNACVVWNDAGTDVTMMQAVTTLAAKAKQILCFGTCASFGGVPAAGPNPAAIQSVQAITKKKTVNISGCPPHPSWMVWGIANAISNTIGSLDSSGRPTGIYNSTIHSKCPRRDTDKAQTYGIDNHCMRNLNCQGPVTNSPCSTLKWNNGQNWCVDANSQCLGCVNSTFPNTSPMRKQTGS